MFRFLPYLALLLTAVLSQIFIFDALWASVMVAPLVYIVFIVLLPIETSQIVMLASGVVLGFIMDATMGAGGLNSIATIFVAFFRPHILQLLVGNERTLERGIPSSETLGGQNYFRYLLLMVSLHSFIFFAFETLSFANFMLSVERFVLSTLLSLLFVWLIARIFLTSNILRNES